MESLKSKKELPTSNILQNKDTQTSGASKSSTATKSTTRIDDKENKHAKSKNDVLSVNFSRGSHLDDLSFANNIFENSLLKLRNGIGQSQQSSGLDISQINSSKSFFENNIQNLNNFENMPTNNFAGFSLNMVSVFLHFHQNFYVS